MRKDIINILLKILIFIVVFFTFSKIPSLAQYEIDNGIKIASVLNTNAFKPNNLSNVDAIVEKGGTIIEVIRVIGIIVTVISLMLLGIKYMTGSVEEKADYKKTMIPYLIGVVIFFSLSTILTTIIQLVADL